MKQKIKSYQELFQGLVSSVNLDQLAAAAKMVSRAYVAKKQIFTAGNGGSAALAVHFAADFGKNVAGPNETPPRILSLCCNSSTITALGNDCGYDNVFSLQLRSFLNPGDLVLLLSSSGNSPNVVKAAEFAKANGAEVLGMTGFSGGKLKEISDFCLHVPCNVYELVEDVHSFFCHAIIHACKKR